MKDYVLKNIMYKHAANNANMDRIKFKAENSKELR